MFFILIIFFCFFYKVDEIKHIIIKSINKNSTEYEIQSKIFFKLKINQKLNVYIDQKYYEAVIYNIKYIDNKTILDIRFEDVNIKKYIKINDFFETKVFVGTTNFLNIIYGFKII
ncbi:hypothetical protein [Mycoplasmopsis maculosa]|uniref:hypothetical protein n=1 Tax=Mycoplasmopsis maculosa TaxID=114885 RepID=UPI0038CD61EA